MNEFDKCGDIEYKYNTDLSKTWQYSVSNYSNCQYFDSI
jgi:hypothetical protein